MKFQMTNNKTQITQIIKNKVIKGGIRIRHGLQISDCLTFGGLGL